jgi:hypothetical protein
LSPPPYIDIRLPNARKLKRVITCALTIFVLIDGADEARIGTHTCIGIHLVASALSILDSGSIPDADVAKAYTDVSVDSWSDRLKQRY